MYRAQEIRTIHFELTTKCNARCPMCLRNVLGGRVNPFLPLVELSLEDVKHILPDTFVRQLQRIYFCGNYGDPMMARESLPIVQHLRAVHPGLDMEFFTNGSGQNELWWTSMAQAHVRARFGIDGLEDTNHIYRRGTRWAKIMTNMKAFIAAGGQAEWDFIVFRHNEHQVDQARQLAQDLGVKKFNVKKTGRFFSNTQQSVKDRQEVLDENGQVSYYIEMPENPRYVNSALKREQEIINEFGSLKDFFSQTPVECKVARERSIYISAEGYVFPCCWTANQLYPWYYEERGAPIWKMLEALPGGLQSLNGKAHAIQDIIEGEFFQRRLPESWNKTSVKEGRLFVCAKTCGQGFDAFKAQFEVSGAHVPAGPVSQPVRPIAAPSPEKSY